LGFRTTIEDVVPEGDDATLVLEVECDSELGEGLYSISLGRPDGTSVEVVDERARWRYRTGEEWEWDNGSPVIGFNFRGFHLTSELPRPASLPHLFHAERRRNAKLAEQVRPLYDLVDAFSPFHVYRFAPPAIGRPVAPGEPIHHDGTGVPAYMDELLGARRAEFDRVTAALHQSFPHIKQVQVITHGAPRRGGGAAKGGGVLKGLVFQTESGINVPAELESDGVLLTLAYLCLSTQSAVAVGVEEPESAAYPSLVVGRWRLLQAMVAGSEHMRPIQVVATTHSATLLTAASDPGIVRILEALGDGSSRIYTPPEEHMHDVIYRRLAWTTTA
jgi:hypothetical protein